MAELSDNPTPPYPVPTPGFNPGGDDAGYIRIIDGHKPWSGGIEGGNVHHPGQNVGGPIGLPVSECNDLDD